MYDENWEKKNTEVFQCPNCGGSMKFDPASQKLKCERCGSDMEPESGDDAMQASEVIVEHDFNRDELETFDGWTDQNRVYRCDFCGAVTTLDIHEAAGNCPFCGSPQIVSTDESPGIKPESVLPFSISEDAAAEKFRKWIKGKFFAAGAAKSEHTLGSFTGIYMPFWTYDADTYSSYVVRVGNHYTDSDGNVHTRWHTERGTHSRFFDDVLVPASKTLDSGEIHDIYPYDTAYLKPYKHEYLSGFIAERYTIGLKEGFDIAEGIMDDRIRDEIRASVYGDEVNIVSLKTTMKDITFKHILVPIWVSTFICGNKSYRFMVNGQTGKVSGKYPYSYPKIAAVVLVILVIVLIMLYLLSR